MTNVVPYQDVVSDATLEEIWCPDCCTYHKKMTGYLPDRTRVIILQTSAGFRVHVGPGRSLRLPVQAIEVGTEIVSQWRELKGKE